jgi:hypothetical protein
LAAAKLATQHRFDDVKSFVGKFVADQTEMINAPNQLDVIAITSNLADDPALAVVPLQVRNHLLEGPHDDVSSHVFVCVSVQIVSGGLG